MSFGNHSENGNVLGCCCQICFLTTDKASFQQVQKLLAIPV